jgi:WD40 repeat protein
MKFLARRTACLSGGSALAIALAALTGCGGGSDEGSRPEADAAATTLQAPVRHAAPYKRVGITAIVASSDGKSLAVAHSDGRVTLLDAASRVETKQLVGPGDRVAAGLVFTSDGRYLVSVDRDSVARVWNVETGAATLTLHGHEQPLRSVSASADSSLIATAGEETRVMLWNGSTGQLKRILSGPTDFVNSVSVSQDGRWIASGDANARVMVWNAATGQVVATLRGHSSEVNVVAFSPDGRTLASAGEDGKVIIWPVGGGQGSSVLESGGPSVRSLAFSSDGQALAAGSADGKVKLWDMASRAVVSESSASASAVNALAFGIRDRGELLFGDGHSGVLAMAVSRQAAR